MGIIEILILGLGLSMDAFAVAIGKGLSIKKLTTKKCIKVGAYFGIFQGVMPILGYYFGNSLNEKIKSFGYFISFVLLSIIGINMIKEALSKHEENHEKEDLSFKSMTILSFATSIDALIAGITLAILKADIITAAFSIGITTMILSAIGVKIGNVFGEKYKSKAEIVGGIILIMIGIKTLIL